MNLFLILLIVITVLNLVWLVVAIITDGDIATALLVFVFVVGIGCWIIAANVVETSTALTKIEDYDIELVNSVNSIFVISEIDNVYIFNKKRDFVYITDTTTFYYEKSINLYGNTISKNIFYYTTNDTIQKGDSFSIRNITIKNKGEEL
jgi:hypothetical protein